MELKLETLELPAAELGGESGVPDLLGENILQNRLTFCLDEDDEIYEGYGRRENAYPYRRFNRYGAELHAKSVRTAVLENRYLKAAFLPDYGGRLWSLIDKGTGRNLLYTNDVLQFRNLAVCNAWFSGGVEWNIGVIGHTPYTAAPLYVGTLENERGNAVLRMYEYERIRGLFYQMDFWLDEDDRFLNCRMRVVNESADVVPMYWWSNIAVPEFRGGRIVVPSERAYTNKDGKVYAVDTTDVDGIDVKEYGKIPRSVDYFFDIKADRPKYIANLDRDGFGLLQFSTSRLQSRKLFCWGHVPASRRWQDFLTRGAGDYIEIQAGLAKTQYGCIPMAPHTAWEWMEQYGPAGLSEAEIAARADKLEGVLRETKAMAKTKCRLISAGSGYGAFARQGRASAHLEFTVESEGLKRWKEFLDTGVLHCPPPTDRPDAFWNDGDSFALLRETIEGKNKDNWYAHYQLGVRYCVDKRYADAERELLASYDLAPSPWACHALGCVCYAEGGRAAAVRWVLAGLELEREDVSYLKETFKLLHLCRADGEIVAAYGALAPAEQAISRLKFYFISAKARMGEIEEAYALLTEDGGLDVEDMREGEDSVGRLWSELHTALFGPGGRVPYRFDFGAFQ